MVALDVQFYRDEEGFLVAVVLNDVGLPVYAVTIETQEDWLAVMESIKDWLDIFEI